MQRFRIKGRAPKVSIRYVPVNRLVQTAEQDCAELGCHIRKCGEKTEAQELALVSSDGKKTYSVTPYTDSVGGEVKGFKLVGKKNGVDVIYWVAAF